jgi:hypothetical protein
MYGPDKEDYLSGVAFPVQRPKMRSSNTQAFFIVISLERHISAVTKIASRAAGLN